LITICGKDIDMDFWPQMAKRRIRGEIKIMVFGS
jgi:hypothetical protein